VNAKRFLTFVAACSAALLLLLPAEAAAQRRGGSHGGGSGRAAPAPPSSGARAVPRAGYPAGSRPFYGNYPGRYSYYRPYYVSPFFYNGFYASFYYGLGWYPYYWNLAYGYPSGYGYGYGYQWGYPYPAYAYRAWSSARLEMKPRDAQVFVDGYYVGTVDNFDGVFQRLDVPAGQHDLTVYLPGYRTWKEHVMFQPGEGYHFKGDLEPLPPGATPEARPQPTNPPAQNRNYGPPAGTDRQPNENPNAGGAYVYPQGPYRQPPPPPDSGGRTQPMRGNESADFGTLNLRVQPLDASVQIDGEKWDSPEGGSRLVVQLAAGPHRIEVRKDGFRPYSTTIQVRPGEQQSLNVVLPQQN
jgi:hypothetical protein